MLQRDVKNKLGRQSYKYRHAGDNGDKMHSNEGFTQKITCKNIIEIERKSRQKINVQYIPNYTGFKMQ